MTPAAAGGALAQRVVGARIRRARARVATRHPPRAFGRALRLATRALDAAQPFDFEAKQRTKVEKKRKLKIGIVGFGNFGQFLAKRFIKNGHDVIATSRSDYDAIAAELGVGYYRDPDDFCEMHPDVVIFCTSILSTEATINAFPITTPTQHPRR